MTEGAEALRVDVAAELPPHERVDVRRGGKRLPHLGRVVGVMPDVGPRTGAAATLHATKLVMNGEREQEEAGSSPSGPPARRPERVEASDIEREIRAPRLIYIIGWTVEFVVFLFVLWGIVWVLLRACGVVD
ncbi:hypothetical protein [Sorangium cellulosum]|nr:hypothetical protein [Sorangium cellulosum]